MSNKRSSDRKKKNPDFIEWRGSAAKERLLKDLKDGQLPLENTELSVEDAWVHYEKEAGFENVVFKQFKQRLADHRKQVKKMKEEGKLEKEKDPKKKGWIDWRSKEADKPKAAIIEDLVQGILALDDSEMTAEEAWTHYKDEEGFENVVFSQFKERLAAHRKQVKKTIARSR